MGYLVDSLVLLSPTLLPPLVELDAESEKEVCSTLEPLCLSLQSFPALTPSKAPLLEGLSSSGQEGGSLLAGGKVKP